MDSMLSYFLLKKCKSSKNNREKRECYDEFVESIKNNKFSLLNEKVLDNYIEIVLIQGNISHVDFLNSIKLFLNNGLSLENIKSNDKIIRFLNTILYDSIKLNDFVNIVDILDKINSDELFNENELKKFLNNSMSIINFQKILDSKFYEYLKTKAYIDTDYISNILDTLLKNDYTISSSVSNTIFEEWFNSMKNNNHSIYTNILIKLNPTSELGKYWREILSNINLSEFNNYNFFDYEYQNGIPDEDTFKKMFMTQNKSLLLLNKEKLSNNELMLLQLLDCIDINKMNMQYYSKKIQERSSLLEGQKENFIKEIWNYGANGINIIEQNGNISNTFIENILFNYDYEVQFDVFKQIYGENIPGKYLEYIKLKKIILESDTECWLNTLLNNQPEFLKKYFNDEEQNGTFLNDYFFNDILNDWGSINILSFSEKYGYGDGNGQKLLIKHFNDEDIKYYLDNSRLFIQSVFNNDKEVSIPKIKKYIHNGKVNNTTIFLSHFNDNYKELLDSIYGSYSDPEYKYTQLDEYIYESFKSNPDSFVSSVDLYNEANPDNDFYDTYIDKEKLTPEFFEEAIKDMPNGSLFDILICISNEQILNSNYSEEDKFKVLISKYGYKDLINNDIRCIINTKEGNDLISNNEIFPEQMIKNVLGSKIYNFVSLYKMNEKIYDLFSKISNYTVLENLDYYILIFSDSSILRSERLLFDSFGENADEIINIFNSIEFNQDEIDNNKICSDLMRIKNYISSSNQLHEYQKEYIENISINDILNSVKKIVTLDKEDEQKLLTMINNKDSLSSVLRYLNSILSDKDFEQIRYDIFNSIRFSDNMLFSHINEGKIIFSDYQLLNQIKGNSNLYFYKYIYNNLDNTEFLSNILELRFFKSYEEFSNFYKNFYTGINNKNNKIIKDVVDFVFSTNDTHFEILYGNNNLLEYLKIQDSEEKQDSFIYSYCDRLKKGFGDKAYYLRNTCLTILEDYYKLLNKQDVTDNEKNEKKEFLLDSIFMFPDEYAFIFKYLDIEQKKCIEELFKEDSKLYAYMQLFYRFKMSDIIIKQYFIFNPKVNRDSFIDEINSRMDCILEKYASLFAQYGEIINSIIDNSNKFYNLDQLIEIVNFISNNSNLIAGYANSVKKYNDFSNLSISEIIENFNEYGPTQKLYNLALVSPKWFNFLLSNASFASDVYKNVNIDESILNNYKTFICNYGFVLSNYITSADNIIDYFDKSGLKPNLIRILFDDQKLNILYEELYKMTNEKQQNAFNILIPQELQMIKSYYKISNEKLKEKFTQYLYEEIEDKKRYENLNVEKIAKIEFLFDRIEKSNSVEMRTKCFEFVSLLLDSSDDIEIIFKNLEKVENIFLESNLPYVAKVFNVFKTLHPDYSKFDLSDESMMSPILLKSSTSSKDIIIFADLLRACLGSNNRSMKEYLENIEKRDILYQQLKSKERKYSELGIEEKNILESYVKQLQTLYYQTKEGKNNQLILTNDVEKNIQMLSAAFGINNGVLKDRLIRMFFYFSYFNDFEQDKTIKNLTFNDVKKYIETLTQKIDKKNRKFESDGEFTLEIGDFAKGIGGIEYLGYLLNNGSVAREFLGSAADSDATPLDADFSIILNNKVEKKEEPAIALKELSKENEEKKPIENILKNYACYGYGPIWIVLKNRPNRFNVTRKSSFEKNQDIDKGDLSKLEMFFTGKIGADHYGLRTGFASGEIDYMIINSSVVDINKVGLEIAINGFYIPVIDMQGNLIFTSEMYDKIRSKMAGLSYYDESNYALASTVISDEAKEMADKLKNNEKETFDKREAIYKLIEKALVEFAKEEGENPLKLKTLIDGDLTSGSVELLDTGSTGRKTNMPGDGDFDLMMRVDQNLILDNDKLLRLKQKILDVIDPNGPRALVDGDIREYKANIDVNGVSTQVEIDITFIVKSNNNGLNYPTEECVKDRLKSIQTQHSEQYDMVLANILLAKKLLKGIQAYKPSRKDYNQGGMGGVGVENWILQNGGSLLEAAKSFMEVASKSSSFEEFKKMYRVDDFGINHMAEKKGIYPHDNFIYNMNDIGYEKMKYILGLYLEFYLENGYTSVDDTLNKIDKTFIAKKSYVDNNEDSLIEDISVLLAVDKSLINKTSLSSSGYMYEVEKNGQTWLIKPGVNKGEMTVKPARVEIQVLASKLQEKLGLVSHVPVYSCGAGFVRCAVQPKYNTQPSNDLILEHSTELLGEYVIDYLIGNYDSDNSNFIVDSDGILRGIDKEQGLKYLMIESNNEESLNLLMNYSPKGTRGTIYPELFRRYSIGEIDLDLNYLKSIIIRLKEISDVEYINLFKNYINLYQPENPEEKIKAILERKNYFINNIENFINNLKKEDLDDTKQK